MPIISMFPSGGGAGLTPLTTKNYSGQADDVYETFYVEITPDPGSIPISFSYEAYQCEYVNHSYDPVTRKFKVGFNPTSPGAHTGVGVVLMTAATSFAIVNEGSSV